MKQTPSKKGRRPEMRSLKIHSKFRANRHKQKLVPEIKLCGNWLEKAGFEREQRVNITAMKRLLIIHLDE